ncbi:MAG TPA: glycerol kinase, partial [Dehalococcoidia bacterium]|nr:glycerol kinase [Dehalococcoidia bacterium]
VLGRRIVRPTNLETTAMGAAYLAGIGGGVWSGQDEVAALWRAERVFEPALPASEREARYADWRRAVERARGWAAPSVAYSSI